MFKKVRFFGVRRLLNRLVDWVNGHEQQSLATLQFRDETEADLADLFTRVAALEECLSGNQIKKLKPIPKAEIVYAKRSRPRRQLTVEEIIKFARALDTKHG